MLQGLEVIEAHYLFGPSYDAIDIVIHPQSIIHSMVETADSSVLGQVSLLQLCSCTTWLSDCALPGCLAEGLVPVAAAGVARHEAAHPGNHGLAREGALLRSHLATPRLHQGLPPSLKTVSYSGRSHPSITALACRSKPRASDAWSLEVVQQ